jgi:hypothetical protein
MPFNICKYKPNICNNCFIYDCSSNLLCNKNKLNKGMCLICCDENIPIRKCDTNNCDYTMCRKCYKKYYKQYDKCPACRSVQSIYKSNSLYRKMSYFLFDKICNIFDICPVTITTISLLVIIFTLGIYGRIWYIISSSLLWGVDFNYLIANFWCNDFGIFLITAIIGLVFHAIFIIIVIIIVNILYCLFYLFSSLFGLNLIDDD